MKRICFLLLAALFLAAALAGCSDSSAPSARNPVTLTMWHNYGGEMQQSMDLRIDEFNATVGKKKGIIVNVTAISSGICKRLRQRNAVFLNVTSREKRRQKFLMRSKSRKAR